MLYNNNNMTIPENNRKLLCYNTWKNLEFNRKSIVPSNSRPLTNGNLTNYNTLYNTVYVKSRKPSASKTACRIGENLNYEKGIYVKASPNPIKHWRRQLLPNQTYATNSRITISTLERPGGSNIVQLLNNNDRGITSDIIIKNGCRTLIQSQTEEGKEQELNQYTNSKNSKCISQYIAKNESSEITSSRCRTRRIRNVSTILENSSSSTKGYLQSRVKTYEQNIAIDFNNKPTSTNDKKNISLYSNYAKHRFDNRQEQCNNSNNVTYKLFCDISLNSVCNADKQDCNKVIHYSPTTETGLSSRQYIARRRCNTSSAINRFGLDGLKVSQISRDVEKCTVNNISRRMPPATGVGINPKSNRCSV